MLNPRVLTPKAISNSQKKWRESGSIRIENAFLEAHAAAFLEALRTKEHTPIYQAHPTEGFQLWRFSWLPGEGCEHPLCHMGRWLHAEGVTWASAITGLPLSSKPETLMISDRLAKACFFDAYNESKEGHAVAFQLHLTPSSWPASLGGHLELMETQGGEASERFSPSWNCIDLFNVQKHNAWRRMPMIQTHLDGFIVSGWFQNSSSPQI